MSDLYNNKDIADSYVNRSVHITTQCMRVDVKGVIEKYDNFLGEIIYFLKTKKGGRIMIGAKSPGLNIEIIEGI